MVIKYNFPANKRAQEAKADKQIEKIEEELTEVKQAYWGDFEDRYVIEETLDLIYACEGLLRKYPKRFVDAIYEEVVQKAKSRGDIQ